MEPDPAQILPLISKNPTVHDSKLEFIQRTETRQCRCKQEKDHYRPTKSLAISGAFSPPISVR